MKRLSYSEQFKQQVTSIIDMLDDLQEIQKNSMRARWLDQVIWLEKASNRSRIGYYALRIVAIVGGVTIPALVSLNVNGTSAAAVQWAAFGLSLAVASSIAIEEFLNLGERWRHYRRTVELLKSEGWNFLQKSDRYSKFDTHESAYPEFASQVERISQYEVEEFIREVVYEKEAKGTQA